MDEQAKLLVAVLAAVGGPLTAWWGYRKGLKTLDNEAKKNEKALNNEAKKIDSTGEEQLRLSLMARLDKVEKAVDAAQEALKEANSLLREAQIEIVNQRYRAQAAEEKLKETQEALVKERILSAAKRRRLGQLLTMIEKCGQRNCPCKTQSGEVIRAEVEE